MNMTAAHSFLDSVITTGRRALPILLSRRAITIGLLFWIPIITFIGVADNVLEGDTLTFDRAVLHYINNSFSNSKLDPYIVAYTNLGGLISITAIVTGVVLLLLGRGYRRSASFVLTVVGGTAVMNVLLKALFARDRPSLFESIILENSFSFPSGHAMMSSALAFAAILLAWRTKYRWPVTIAAILFFVSISFTRLYLGVHYPTDLLAGWCISGAWVVAAYYMLRMHLRANIRP